MKKACEVCQSIFETKRADQRFCSHVCHGMTRKRLEGRICRGCGAGFEVRPCSSRVFCTRECMYQNRSLPVTSPRMIPCAFCGEEFRAKKPGSKFCSPRCSGLSRVYASPSDAPPEKREISCERCGKGFLPRGDANRYCSRECHFATLRTERACVGCGLVFIISKASTKKYCSRECFWRNHFPKKPRVSEAGYVSVAASEADVLSGFVSKEGFVPEHRLKMARHLGRPLTKRETIHHVDGNPSNNAIENLQLRQGQHGKGAGPPLSLLRLYGPGAGPASVAASGGPRR